MGQIGVVSAYQSSAGTAHAQAYLYVRPVSSLDERTGEKLYEWLIRARANCVTMSQWGYCNLPYKTLMKF
jgi:hypothetical protein